MNFEKKRKNSLFSIYSQYSGICVLSDGTQSIPSESDLGNKSKRYTVKIH